MQPVIHHMAAKKKLYYLVPAETFLVEHWLLYFLGLGLKMIAVLPWKERFWCDKCSKFSMNYWTSLDKGKLSVFKISNLKRKTHLRSRRGQLV